MRVARFSVVKRDQVRIHLVPKGALPEKNLFQAIVKSGRGLREGGGERDWMDRRGSGEGGIRLELQLGRVRGVGVG